MTRRFRQPVALVAVLAIAGAGLFVTVQRSPSAADPYQMEQLLYQVEASTYQFRRSVNQRADRIWRNDTGEGRAIGDLVSDFVGATQLLREGFDREQNVKGRVEDVLRCAASINTFLDRHLPPVQVEQDWFGLRRVLDDLARAYGVSPNWNTLGYALVAVVSGGWASDAIERDRFESNKK